MNNLSNPAPSSKQPISKKSITFGILVILFGVILLLRNFDLIDSTFKQFIFSWKTLLIAIGIISLTGKEYFSGLMLIAIGTIFHLTSYFAFPINLKLIMWPTAIIILGLAIIFKNKKLPFKPTKIQANSVADYFEDTTIFGGTEKLINNHNFKGAKLTAIFGGSEFNLQQIELSEAGATIDITMVFGGCVLIVPPDWNIHLGVNNIFGGISDKRIPSAIDTTKNVYIKGICVFGGCEIKSF